MSTMGISTWLRSAPDQCIVDIVSAIVPGVRTLASSIHASGAAPDTVGPPGPELGRELLLGGELWCPLPLPFPCAAAGRAQASASATLAITDAIALRPRITRRRPPDRPCGTLAGASSP